VWANRLIALGAPEIWSSNTPGFFDVNCFVNANGATVENAGCHFCHMSIAPWLSA